MIFRILFAALLLSGVAVAQNIKTVMADTNGVIRGNAALEARIASGGAGAASTNDLAAVSNRVVAVEAGTNKWNAAHGWGNHAVAGYLTSFAETDPFFTAWRSTNTYVKVEQDTTALGVIATQKIARIELNNRIIDATNGVWEVIEIANTNWYFTHNADTPAYTAVVSALSYPLSDNFYFEFPFPPEAVGSVSCMTDLPAYDRYTAVDFPGFNVFYGTADPLTGFVIVDGVEGVVSSVLYRAQSPGSTFITNHIGTLALQSAVDAVQSDLSVKADKATTLTINGVTGNLSSNNVWATPSISALALTNGVSVYGGWSNVYPTVVLRWGTTNFNVVIKAP